MHAVYGPPSRAHSNVDPAVELEKLNVALVAVVVLAGPLSIAVSGGVVSGGGAGATTVHVCVAGVASVLPLVSVARTLKVWLPTETAA